MSSNLIINVAEDFAKRLGARYIYEGKNSGEDFLVRFLKPKFYEAKEKRVKLLIYLDGVLGYPSSFVSGSFGKLSLEIGANIVSNIIELISDNRLRVEKIKMEINNPQKK